MIETDLSKQIPANDEAWIVRRKRLRLYRITEEVLLDVIAGKVKISRMPQGAILRSVHLDLGLECLVLKVWCDLFEPVPEGARIPYDDAPFEKVV